jgi:hypothetical protein
VLGVAFRAEKPAGARYLAARDSTDREVDQDAGESTEPSGCCDGGWRG